MGKGAFTLGLLDALGHLGRACQRRRSVRGEGLLSDKEILKRVGRYQEKGE